MSLRFLWRSMESLPVDGSVLRPEVFRDKSSEEASRFRVRLGNGKAELGELFRVEGGSGDDRLVVEGDLSHVYRLGQGMTLGHLEVRGEAGPQLGAGMTGGTIVVEGPAGDWAGAEMRGGMITIRGEAGRFLGAAYPGSRAGMREGVIMVEGSAGDDSGLQMRRGLIAIRGDAGEGLGRSMIAGTILVLGTPGRRAGAGMKRGTLVFPSPVLPADDLLLPSFAEAGRFRAPFLALYAKQLESWGFPVPGCIPTVPLHRYNGDLAIGGQGEILIGLPASSNS